MRIDPATSLAEGQFLGHYQLVRRLDKRYGIEIWHAQHIVIQVPVVLKVVLPDKRTSEEYQRDVFLLQNEARVLSALHHQYIIGYRDFIEGRNFCVLVLEYAPYRRPAHGLHGLLAVARGMRRAQQRFGLRQFSIMKRLVFEDIE